jgi:6-pyruvoyl-tetrahydropterin synthase
MNYKEEQEQEIEALSFIFPNEMTVSSPNNLHFIIPTEQGETLYEMTVTLPETYPEIPPEIELKCELLKSHDSLLLSLQEEMNNLLGMAMIFSIIQYLKDEIYNEINKEQIEPEQEEMIKDKITRQSFMEWKNRFINEAFEAKKKGNSLINAFEILIMIEQGKKERGQTGRMIFEKDKGMLKSDEKYMEEGEDVEIVISIEEEEEEEEQGLVFDNE